MAEVVRGVVEGDQHRHVLCSACWGAPIADRPTRADVYNRDAFCCGCGNPAYGGATWLEAGVAVNPCEWASG